MLKGSYGSVIISTLACWFGGRGFNFDIKQSKKVDLDL